MPAPMIATIRSNLVILFTGISVSTCGSGYVGSSYVGSGYTVQGSFESSELIFVRHTSIVHDWAANANTKLRY